MSSAIMIPMNLVHFSHLALTNCPSTKFTRRPTLTEPLRSPTSLLSPFSFLSLPESSFICFCTNSDDPRPLQEGFSALSADIPWKSDGSVWSNFALYLFSVHVPLSFGGLSVVSKILQKPVLDPQTEIISLLLIQTAELVGTLFLLKLISKPRMELFSFLKPCKLQTQRNWLLASIIGFGILILFVLISSFTADVLIGPKDVNDPVLKEILHDSDISRAACVLLYCIITPMLEETVYRSYLVTSLASTMNWQNAVLLSSAIFSIAHFSSENSVQLFIIGCILGCTYCWTGNLKSSILVHSLYNAVTIMISLLS